MCGQSWVYNRYATTHIINPLVQGFSSYQNVNKEIIISTREYFSIFIPEVIRLLGFSISLHFVDFSIITNQIIKNRKVFVFRGNYSEVNTNENAGKQKSIRNCRGSNTNESTEKQECIRNRRGTNTNNKAGNRKSIRNCSSPNTNENAGKQECIRN